MTYKKHSATFRLTDQTLRYLDTGVKRKIGVDKTAVLESWVRLGWSIMQADALRGRIYAPEPLIQPQENEKPQVKQEKIAITSPETQGKQGREK